MPYLGDQACYIRLLDERPGREVVCELRVIVRGGTALGFTVSGPLSVAEGEYLGHKAMRTQVRGLLGVGAVDFTTILLNGYAVHVSASSTAECTDDAAPILRDELDALRGALEVDSGLETTSIPRERCVDR